MRLLSWGMAYLLMVTLQRDKIANLKKNNSVKSDNVVINYEVKRFPEWNKQILFKEVKKWLFSNAIEN